MCLLACPVRVRHWNGPGGSRTPPLLVESGLVRHVCPLYSFAPGWSENEHDDFIHYGDVIMDTVASQITSPTIVYSTVPSEIEEKTSKLRVTGLCAGNSPVTGEFPVQMASNAANISIWWRHHADISNPHHWPAAWWRHHPSVFCTRRFEIRDLRLILFKIFDRTFKCSSPIM